MMDARVLESSSLEGRSPHDMKHYGFDSIRVKQSQFLPLLWSFTAFSFLFLPLRYWTRWKTFRRFFSDDYFALLAWLCAAALPSLAVYYTDAMYFTIGLVLNPPASAADIGPNEFALVRRFSYCSIISFMLMYTSLFLVKLSFLLFFYRLGPKLIQNIKWHWWIVAVITFAAYIASFATYPYKCTFGSLAQISSPYCTAEQNMAFLNMKVNTTLDVLTDLLIVTIPLNILRRSRIPRRQSLALGGVFSLVLVTITFAIVRATVTTVGVQRQMDIPWVVVWSSAEANIAIVVVCIGSFRMLFVQNRKEERSPLGDVGQRRRVEKTSVFTFGATVEDTVDVELRQSLGRGTIRSSSRGGSAVATETERDMETARSVSSSGGSNVWQTTQGSSVLDWEQAGRSR